jgi:hypothetical protein
MGDAVAVFLDETIDIMGGDVVFQMCTGMGD